MLQHSPKCAIPFETGRSSTRRSEIPCLPRCLTKGKFWDVAQACQCRGPWVCRCLSHRCTHWNGRFKAVRRGRAALHQEPNAAVAPFRLWPKGDQPKIGHRAVVGLTRGSLDFRDRGKDALLLPRQRRHTTHRDLARLAGARNGSPPPQR